MGFGWRLMLRIVRCCSLMAVLCWVALLVLLFGGFVFCLWLVLLV